LVLGTVKLVRLSGVAPLHPRVVCSFARIIRNSRLRKKVYLLFVTTRVLDDDHDYDTCDGDAGYVADDGERQNLPFDCLKLSRTTAELKGLCLSPPMLYRSEVIYY
jgi:hypothetical protein